MVTVYSGGRYHLASLPKKRQTSHFVGSFAANSCAVIFFDKDATEPMLISVSGIVGGKNLSN